MKDIDREDWQDGADEIPPVGAVVVINTVPHRTIAYFNDRALLTDLKTHHPWLTQDDDGSLQLPKEVLLKQMVQSGVVRPAEGFGPDISPTEKLKFVIDLLDQHRVRQGDKSIWQFLTKAWTPDLVERFGPHDDPWRIRRWRAALRKAAKERPMS